MVIGLDVSTVTGWCFWGDGGYECGEMKFPKLAGIRRAIAFSDWFVPHLTTLKPELVIFEGYGYGQISSIQPLTEIGTMLRAVTLLEGFSWIEVPPMSLKKFTTGKGNAKKDEMMLHVYKRWGYEAPSNNMADAFALAQVGLGWLGQVEMTTFQAEVVKKLKLA